MDVEAKPAVPLDAMLEKRLTAARAVARAATWVVEAWESGRAEADSQGGQVARRGEH